MDGDHHRSDVYLAGVLGGAGRLGDLDLLNLNGVLAVAVLLVKLAHVHRGVLRVR